MTSTSYTERRYTMPEEHTLYPRPEHVYECTECGAAGYHYPAWGEVWCYRKCIWQGRVNPGNRHVWVRPGTIQTQGTGERVFT